MTDSNTNTINSNTAAEHVRAYLDYLRDPESIVDDAAIQAKWDEVLAEEDGLRKLELHAELARIQNPDASVIEQGFIDHAKTWADGLGITAKSFQEVHKVPTKVLKKAGFKVGRASGGQRVSSDHVRNVIPDDGTFTIKQVHVISGASLASARNIVKEMVADGELAYVGPDPSFTGKGTAPALYQRA